MDQLKPRPANSCPLTPLGFLERAATVYADCNSIIYNSTTYTWSQTYRRCLQLASSIASLGIKPVLEALSLFPQESQFPILAFINTDAETPAADLDYESLIEKGDAETPAADLDYESLIEKGDAEFKWIQPQNEWTPIVLNYTSGTTSSPKGVVHTS
ncbi:hypothetical protein IFM89_007727 [Coptis chinensis]|uniref:AMP-dependent synthetase/ligase domain-containing protein n=1 Tax=Coptis chinensis TaxID=261450 RepID=A0A835IV82_9MAGN|nr:hypothetical protein IFM89_007727 [Coptis chinensis]